MVTERFTVARLGALALVLGAWFLAGPVGAADAEQPAVWTARRQSAASELWLCREARRVVVRTTAAGVVLFRLARYPDDRFACLRGNRYAVSFPRPRDGTDSGTADLQFAGTFMTIQNYGGGCSSGSCDGPEAFLVDLRTVKRVIDGTLFRRAVRIRANASGDAALIVRDSPGPDLDSGYPPGPGPFRVDLCDRNGRHTVDSGPGIDPSSLNVTGRLVTWLHDGAQRSATLARRRRPSACQSR